MNVPMNCVGNVIYWPEITKYFDGVSTGGYSPPINFTRKKLTQTKKQWFVKCKTITDTNNSKCTELYAYNYEEQQMRDDRLQSSDHTSVVCCTYRVQPCTLHKHHNAKCNNSLYQHW